MPAALLYGVVAGGLCLWLYPLLMIDSLARYAPMAEAFARGEWSLAFHPRFGVLFSSLAGLIVMLTGLGGDQAVQLSSIAFLALAGVPLWFVFRSVFGAPVAWGAVLLFWVSNDLLRYAIDGLRDSGKCLGFALLALGCVTRRSRWFALGLFVLVTLASYCFVIAGLALLIWCLYFAFRREFAALPLPIAGWILGTAAVTFMVHAYTGHWLPTPHFIRFLGVLL